MKIIKKSLAERYNELQIEYTCDNKDCCTHFVAEGPNDIKSYPTDVFSQNILGFHCPNCSELGMIFRISFDDKELFDYIVRTNPAS